MAERVTIGAVILALIGLGTAAFDHAGEVSDTFCKYVWNCTSRPKIEGHWIGVYKDTNEKRTPPRTTPDFITTENVTINVASGRISGQTISSDSPARIHAITSDSVAFLDSEQQKGFLIISAAAKDESERQLGGFTHLLMGSFSGQNLYGYITSWNPEVGAILTCPYILTREPNFESVKKNDWLKDKRCYPY